MTEHDADFWAALDELVAHSRVVIDRPKGTTHPRYPAFFYPLDYGYLEATHSIDGGGVDVWAGSLPEKSVTAVVCTVDALKRDAEVKILLGCTTGEARIILDVHNGRFQSAVLLEREGS